MTWWTMPRAPLNSNFWTMDAPCPCLPGRFTVRLAWPASSITCPSNFWACILCELASFFSFSTSDHLSFCLIHPLSNDGTRHETRKNPASLGINRIDEPDIWVDLVKNQITSTHLSWLLFFILLQKCCRGAGLVDASHFDSKQCTNEWMWIAWIEK